MDILQRGTGAPKSAPDSLRYTLGKQIYFPRVAGFFLSSLMLITALYEQKRLFDWPLLASLIATCYLWPHVAYRLSRLTKTSNRAELYNLLFDMLLGGIWSYLIDFNPVPVLVMHAMLSMDAMAVAGFRFYLIGNVMFLLGCLAPIPLFGFRFDPATSVYTIVSCIPVMLMFPAMNGYTAFMRTMKVKKVKKLLEDSQRMASADMAMAVSVQMSVLPDAIPASSEWEIAYHFKPMVNVAGDFYDFYIIDETLVGLGIFDVSGHGISSGLVTMLAKSIIFHHYRDKADRPLGEVFMSVNDDLNHEINNQQYYLTGILLRFKGDRVEYANAVHPDMYRKSRYGASPVRKEDGSRLDGFFIGLLSHDIRHESMELHVEQGDYILLFTDGLVESRNLKRQEYGEDRIRDSLAAAPRGSARDVLDHILGDFNRFVADKDYLNDDLTIIVAKKL